MWRSIAAVLLVQLATAQNAPLYEFGDDSSLIQIDDSNFESLVLKDDKHLWVVEFYADWCGHCKQFAKGYQKAAANLDGIVKFGAVNAEVAKKAASSAGVQGFPSVKLYVPGTGQKNPYTGKFYKPAVDYQGARSAKGVVEFATASLPSQVVPLPSKAALTKFQKNGTLPKAVLVSKKTETTPLLKSLSLAFSGRLLIGEARDTSTEIVEALGGAADFPLLAVLPSSASGSDGGSSGERTVYEGEMKPKALKEFFDQHAAEAPAAEAEGAAGAAEGGGGGGSGDFVVAVDASNVASLVEGERDAWLLIFEGSETTELGSTGGIDALAEGLNGQAKVGKASAEVAGKFGVTVGAAPQVAVWPFRKAGKKRTATVHPGTEEGVTKAKKAVLESLPVEGIEVLTQMSVDRWMQESLQTTEVRAMCMLFSDKPTIPPLFRALALEFDGKMGFGMGQASDKAIAGRFNVQKAPTLLVMFPDTSKAGPDGQGVQLAGMGFDPRHHGKFNFGNIATFLDQFVKMRQQQIQAEGGGGAGGGDGAGGAGGSGGGADGEPAAAPRKQPKDQGPAAELTFSSFDDECVNKGGLCGIAMLDGSPENSASKDASLAMLQRLKSRKAGGPISFSWVDATCQPAFMGAFELSEVDLPTMIFLSPQKLRYARSVGAFDVDTLSSYGNAVAAGKRSTSELSELPSLEDVDCATIKRGADAYASEDDGADDIMAEILEEERKAREEREAELKAEGLAADAAAAAAGGGKKKKEDMSKLEALEAEVEECEAMDLLCSARREKQLKAVEKQRTLEEKLAAIKKKKQKAKKKAKKAAAGA